MVSARENPPSPAEAAPRRAAWDSARVPSENPAPRQSSRLSESHLPLRLMKSGHPPRRGVSGSSPRIPPRLEALPECTCDIVRADARHAILSAERQKGLKKRRRSCTFRRGSAKLTGGAPGLQIRCGGVKAFPGGFDSHALPPFNSGLMSAYLHRCFIRYP